VINIKITTHRVIAAIVFLIAMVNIIATTAPTTSFWDCGEFIAASYTVGVPHPPGAPLYLLVGRLFSMLPLGDNIGWRVNLISGLLSALTVLFLYLSIVRILRAWRGYEETAADKITVYGSAAIGALALAFSHSFWFNAVEAEVYAVSMFFTAFVFYLALLWLDYADAPKGNRILLFIFYLVGLSTGIHLLNILAMLSVVYIIAFQRREVSVKMFIITGLIGSVVIFSIYPGIIQGVPLLIEKFSAWSIIPLFLLLVYLSIYFIKRDKRLPAFAMLSTLLVFIGYSTYLLVKIRSGLDPFLDENDPETWTKLLSYLNREQYGSESLFATMFNRKAPFWSYQINKMYIRYFNWQFLGGQGVPLFIVPFFLGLIGLVHHFYRDAKFAFVILVLFFMTGLAIILYVNQPDPQPRERDYSYVGSFYAFAFWIGIGVTALIEIIQDYARKLNPRIIAGSVTAVCIIVVPFNLWIQNFESHDRSGNYVAWDYSYNLLETCEPNAIIYTNGDNDTFPLWYLQVVEGVRPDIRVANLSLLNTGWFIKQIRDKYPKVPMPSKITDRYVDNVLEARDVSGLMDRHWQEKRRISIDGPFIDSPKLVWDVPATLSYPVGAGGKMEHFLRVQDIMILNTMAANRWERPIYFAVTVSDANLLGLRDIRNQNKNYLSMEGLAFKLHPEPVPLIDTEKIAENMFGNYRYRGVNDPDVYFNANILKLLGNYRTGLTQLAYHYLAEMQQSGDSSLANVDLPLEERIERFESLSASEKALTTLDFMEDRIPEGLIPIKYEAISLQIGRIYSLLHRPEEMRRRLDRMVELGGFDIQKAFEYGLRYLSEAEAPDAARKMFDLVLEQDSRFENYQRIAYSWIQLGQDSSYAYEILLRYIDLNDNRQTKLRVAALSVMLGLNELAFSIYEPMWRADPGDRSAVDGLIQYYRGRNNYQRALVLANDWLGAYPGDSTMARKQHELQLLMK